MMYSSKYQLLKYCINKHCGAKLLKTKLCFALFISENVLRSLKLNDKIGLEIFLFH